jgi:holo-[acyl-carrier protein] synthase
VTGELTGEFSGPRLMIRGIGVDAVDIQRFRRSLERTPSMRQRLFTADELTYVGAKVDPVPSLAARFAAREAAMKALGVGLGAFGFHDVWVRRAESGEPTLVVTGTALQLAQAAGVQHWHLSITHTDALAIAYVVAS